MKAKCIYVIENYLEVTINGKKKKNKWLFFCAVETQKEAKDIISQMQDFLIFRIVKYQRCKKVHKQ